MTIQYSPGDEIELDVESSSRKFFVKAMSWKEQREYGQWTDKAKDEEGGTVEADLILDAIKTRITRTEPPCDLDNLEDVVDLKVIWELHAAIRLNLTYEEKKS